MSMSTPPPRYVGESVVDDIDIIGDPPAKMFIEGIVMDVKVGSVALANMFQDRSSSFFGGRKKKEDTRKKKFLNSTYMNVGRRSLGIYSQAFCRMFAYAVIHTAKRRIGLVLRSEAIYSVGII